MCGRFVSASPPSEIADYFDVELVGDLDTRERYNVAPTDDVYVVYSEGGARRLDAFRWGLVPGGAKDVKVGNRMINARAETLTERGAFKAAFAKRRCIVPATGFYEWRQVEGAAKKQPYFVHRPDGEPYAFGGLWAEWRGADPSGAPMRLRSTTIITGPPNRKMAELHDRMPLILDPGDFDEWLDPSLVDTEPLRRLLVPAPDEVIEFHPVSTEVNNVRHDGPQLIAEAQIPEPEAQLPGMG